VADIQSGIDPTYIVITMKDGSEQYINDFPTEIYGRLDPTGRILARNNAR
jgi:hypothetical protein